VYRLDRSWFYSSLLNDRHPDPTLQFAWNSVQLGLLLLPLSTLIGVLAVLTGAISTWHKRSRVIRSQPFNWGLALLAGLLLLSSLAAYQPTDALLGLFNFLPYLFSFAGLAELIQTTAQLRRIAWLILLSSIPVAAIGAAQLLAGWLGFDKILHIQILWIVVDWVIDPNGTPPGRMSSTLSYANILANYLLLSSILGLGLLVEHLRTRPVPLLPRLKQPTTLLLGAAVLGDAIALILTNSRNAWAISALACLAFAIYLGWRWLLAGTAALTSLVLAAAFAPPPFRPGLRAVVPAFFWARLTDEQFPDRPLPTLRTSQWQFAWDLTQQRPWLGWGLRNFSPLYQAKTQFLLGHPHNLLFMLLCETGIPATALLVGLVGWILFQAVLAHGLKSSHSQHMDGDRLWLFTFWLAFLCNTAFSLFDITLFDARLNVLGWVILAAILGSTRRLPINQCSNN
jgi:O-antigen ligase